MSNLLNKFPHTPTPAVVARGEGMTLVLEDGRRVMDMTAGTTAHAVLGLSDPDVLDAMHGQMARFCHVDYNQWHNPMLDELATVLT